MQKTTKGIKKWLSVKTVFAVAISVIGFLWVQTQGIGVNIQRKPLCCQRDWDEGKHRVDKDPKALLMES